MTNKNNNDGIPDDEVKPIVTKKDREAIQKQLTEAERERALKSLEEKRKQQKK